MDETSSDRRLPMQVAPIPADEAERLAALWRTGLLDSPPSEAFDRVTRSVAGLLRVPIALISLVDERRQWFLSSFGIEARETPRDISFCGHAIAEAKTLRVVDAWVDPRFAGNPLVTDGLQLRAYLGVPLMSEDGHPLGTLCVADRRAREFSVEDQQILARYARAVEHLMRR